MYIKVHVDGMHRSADTCGGDRWIRGALGTSHSGFDGFKPFELPGWPSEMTGLGRPACKVGLS